MACVRAPFRRVMAMLAGGLLLSVMLLGVKHADAFCIGTEFPWCGGRCLPLFIGYCEIDTFDGTCKCSVFSK